MGGKKEENDMGEEERNHGRKMRLVTLEFSDYALVWWTQVLEDIRSGVREPYLSHLFTLETCTINCILYQGSRSVEEYHKGMEIDLMRAQLERQAIKVEVQIRMRNASRKTFVGSNGIGRSKERDEDRLRKDKSPKKRSDSFRGLKEEKEPTTPNDPRTSSIKCFK
ncbi:hypothetical protein CR513_31940, partial [Mucuna pruriens]